MLSTLLRVSKYLRISREVDCCGMFKLLKDKYSQNCLLFQQLLTTFYCLKICKILRLCLYLVTTYLCDDVLMFSSPMYVGMWLPIKNLGLKKKILFDK